MNKKFNKKHRILYLLVGLCLVTVLSSGNYAQDAQKSPDAQKNAPDRKKKSVATTVVLEIPPPVFESDDKVLQEELTYYLKIAAVLDEKNREKPFNLLPNPARGKIARWLEAAAEIEKKECCKKYLSGLAGNIRERGRFSIDLPLWVDLEPDQAGIIFPRADRYSAALQVLETFFPISAREYRWGEGTFYDAVVFFNNPDLTAKFKEYTDIFYRCQDHLYSLPALAHLRPEISYSPIIPSFQVVQLVFTSRPQIKGGILIFPDTPKDQNFKMIVFKNIIESYFENVIQPISARILTAQQGLARDPEIYLSNLMMRRIAHHLGPVFVVVPKDEITAKGEKTPSQKEQKTPREMALKTVSEILGHLFPIVEAIKSQALAIHSTPVLINNGLIHGDNAADVYLTYLVSLVDHLRNIPREMNADQPAGKKSWEELLGDPGKENYLAALIQFNYLLAEDCIVLNIGSRSLDIKREKFPEAIGKLTAEVIRMMFYANYDSVRWFIEKNSTLAPELKEILKSVDDIPSRVEFNLEKLLYSKK